MITDATKTAAKQINAVTDSLNHQTYCLNKLGDHLPMIEHLLSLQGLSISEMYCNKTMIPDSGNVWDEDTKLQVRISAVSTGKFKFIAFAGYKQNGQGRNRNRLVDKAAKIEVPLANLVGSCLVNRHSIEKNSTKDRPSAAEDHVNIQLWISQ